MHTFILLSILIVAQAGPDAAALEKKVEEIEAFLDAHPNHRDATAKRQELADLCFKSSLSLKDDWAATKETSDEGVLRREAIHWFKRSRNEYEKILNPKFGQPAPEGRDAVLLNLKAGICCHLWQDLLRRDKKSRDEVSQLAIGYLHTASWTAEPGDPFALWAWFYTARTYAALERHGELLAITTAVTDPAFLDLKRTLSSRSPDISFIADPLAGLAVLRAECEPDDSPETLVTMIDALPPVKKWNSPMRARLHLKAARVCMTGGDLVKAGKLLVEAGPSPGVAEALPLMEQWIAECIEKMENGKAKRITVLPEVVLALADLHLEAKRYGAALQNYEHFLQDAASKRLIAKYADEVACKKGYCLYHLDRFPEARKALRQGLNGDKPDKKLQTYWYHTLVKLGDPGSVEAGKKLKSMGIDPEAPLPQKPPAPVHEASLHLFERTMVNDKLTLVFQAPEPIKVDRKDKALWKTVELGLDWLIRHQAKEGFWDCDDFALDCRSGTCKGKGTALYDPGCTGLALLALLKANHTPLSGDHCDRVRKGLLFLCDIQDPQDGCLAPKVGLHFMYNHGIACLALTEAYRLSRYPSLAVPACKGIEYIHASKNPGMAWRYNNGEVDPVEQNDISVTGWMVRCLCAAHEAGIATHSRDLEEALGYIELMTDQEVGRTGYKEAGSFSAREESDYTLWSAEKVETLTAEALHCRYLIHRALGGTPDKRTVHRGFTLINEKPPQWNRSEGTIDYYYWHFGSLAMADASGKLFEAWKNAAAKILMENQENKGCSKGSWDPACCPWGDNGGRIYSTAICTLTAESLCLGK